MQAQPSSSILIIDDDPDVLSALRVLLEDEFKTIVTVSLSHRIDALMNTHYDVILLDMNFSAGLNSGNEGLFWLSRILGIQPDARVVMMTAYGNIALAVEALKRGAKDFVLKPWDNEKLIASLRAVLALRKPAAIEPPSVDSSINSVTSFTSYRSAAMQELQRQIERVAATDASVLILGETGTGKGTVARELHRLSGRSGKTFAAVDLPALPPALFESELFGHKKGAFTDARADRPGRFEYANGGTLFLDEIGSLPLPQQSRLLTVLQQREVVPVGSNTPVPVNVRVIAATSAPLLQWVEEGRFRQDLLYRLNTITLTLPPLRERKEDIPPLADHFLDMYRLRYGREAMEFAREARELLQRYHWPGNVRELEHTVEKAVILSHGSVILSTDLNLSISSRKEETGIRTLDELEKEALQQALAQHAGNIVHAARALGITRQTFYNKMKKYGI